LNEYENNKQQLKNSSPLYISVIDCFHFGLKKSTNQLYIDLEENENQLAYEQIEISNQLIQQKKQITSQEIRLHLKEKRQRKIQEHSYEQRKNDLTNSKFYIQNGRKLLKEHQIITSSDNQISLELLDFFSYEYQHENRPHVKRILAELIGVFVEKYGLNYQQITSKPVEGRN
jgi:D-ribose pyranose/furanose isomerase RbsD